MRESNKEMTSELILIQPALRWEEIYIRKEEKEKGEIYKQ